MIESVDDTILRHLRRDLVNLTQKHGAAKARELLQVVIGAGAALAGIRAGYEPESEED